MFNFSDDNFVVNMVDRIAQIVFEKTKTLVIKECKNLEGTDQGASGYGSTSTKTMQENQVANEDANIERKKDIQTNETSMEEMKLTEVKQCKTPLSRL